MFAPLPNSGSSVPSLLHNADALYDSSTSWFRLVDMISQIFGALVEPTPVVAEADADSLAIERNLYHHHSCPSPPTLATTTTTTTCCLPPSLLNTTIPIASKERDEIEDLISSNDQCKAIANETGRRLELIEKADGFARVFPEIAREKHICGMTGDALYDAPTLKKADIGIAVDDTIGVARDASNIVLTEPRLSVMIRQIMTVSKDRAKPSPLPDSCKLKEIWCCSWRIPSFDDNYILLDHEVATVIVVYTNWEFARIKGIGCISVIFCMRVIPGIWRRWHQL
ncbi:plasma membrane ATPase 4 [Tanacetum coccineum]